MATFNERKEVSLSSIVEDLNNGLTKWKKDDIGYGSIEKKYNLTLQEAMELFNHPKIKNLEHKNPKFVIIDDLPTTTEDIKVTVPRPVKALTDEEVKKIIEEETKGPVATLPGFESCQTTQPKKKIEAFI